MVAFAVASLASCAQLPATRELSQPARQTSGSPSLVAKETVRGEVVDQSLAPIEGATVRLVFNGGARATKTARDGSFTLPDVESPVVAVLFTADGYAEARVDGRDFTRGLLWSQKLLRKKTGTGKVAGVVVDDKGAPIRAFQVASVVDEGPLDRNRPPEELQAAFERRDKSYRKIDVTDEHGAFTFELPTGHRSLIVIADGFRRDNEAHVVDVVEGHPASVRVVLEHSNELRGVVTDRTTHKPVGGAAVFVQNAFGSYARTDALGRFAVRSLPRVRYTVLVDAPGYYGLYVGGFHGDSDVNENLDVELTPDPGPMRARGSLAVGPREYVGLGVHVSEDPRGLLVEGVTADAPAIGVLTKGDIIVDVDGTSLAGREIYESTAILGGKEGTEARIAVLREGERVEVDPIVRKRLGPYGGEPTQKPALFLSLSFDDALARAKAEKKLLLVDGTATWCGPCQRMDQTTWIDAAVIKALSEKALAIQIDVEEDSEISKQLGIRSMPTVIVFRDGKEQDRVVGFQNATQLLDWLDGLERGKDPAHRMDAKASAH